MLAKSISTSDHMFERAIWDKLPKCNFKIGGTSFSCGGGGHGGALILMMGGGGSKKKCRMGAGPPIMGNPVKQALLSKFQEYFRTTVG